MVITNGKRVVSLMVSVGNSFIKTMLLVPKGTCRFIPSCGDYAHEAIETLPIRHAIIKISIRLLRCNPLFKGGYDPVVRTSRKG